MRICAVDKERLIGVARVSSLSGAGLSIIVDYSVEYRICNSGGEDH